MDNLIAIENCKNDIMNALKGKGVDMDGVKFSEYAGKIDALQFESGDAPSTPAPSADCIYTNGYLTGGTEKNEIIFFSPYEIELDGDGKCVFYLTCPVEYPIYDGEHCDIVFTVDVLTSYEIDSFKIYDELAEGADDEGYVDHRYKTNPRHSTIIRDEKEYNSYVRVVNPKDDTDDFGSDYVKIAEAKYKIIIKKK